MRKQGFVYILANWRHTVLYTGVTNNLSRRVQEHRSGIAKGFAARYNVRKLVYYEIHEAMSLAIAREKQIKAGSRQKKVDLISAMNPAWSDLSEQL
jgi:putative endonuclease